MSQGTTNQRQFSMDSSSQPKNGVSPLEFGETGEARTSCISKRSDHFGTFYMLFANLSLFVVLFYFAAFLGLFEKLIFLLKSCNKITLNYTGRHKRDVLNGVILSVGQSSQGRPLNINLPSSKPSSSRVNLSD